MAGGHEGSHQSRFGMLREGLEGSISIAGQEAGDGG